MAKSRKPGAGSRKDKPLTLEQRARRATSKRNNRTRRELPLFGPLLNPNGAMADWLTTAEVQQTRIERQSSKGDDIIARVRKHNEKSVVLAMEYRAIVVRFKTAEEIADLDALFARRYPKDGSYLHEAWFNQLRQVDPPSAWRLCAHEASGFHREMGTRRWHECCPQCGKPLEMGPIEEQPQLSLPACG